jgi:hypothetical protein
MPLAFRCHWGSALDKWWGIHAPPVSDSDVDSGTDEDTGGTERRPMTPGEVQHDQRVRITAHACHQDASMRVATWELSSTLGNGAPAFAFPPLSLRFRGCEGLQRKEPPRLLSASCDGLRWCRAKTEPRKIEP